MTALRQKCSGENCERPLGDRSSGNAMQFMLNRKKRSESIFKIPISNDRGAIGHIN